MILKELIEPCELGKVAAMGRLKFIVKHPSYAFEKKQITCTKLYSFVT